MVVVSPLLPLAFALLLLPSWVDSADPPVTPSTPEQVLPWPAFDPTKCVDETSVFCLLPAAAGDKLGLYTSSESYTAKETQIILRFYNEKKILVEIWSEGGSAELKKSEKDGSKVELIFGCKNSDGKVTAEPEESTSISEGKNTPDAFYCRFTLTSDEEIFPYPTKKDDALKRVTLTTDKTINGYITTRGGISEISSITSCDFEWVKYEPTEIADGYVMKEIPYDLLFGKSITCPANSVLMFEHGKNPAMNEGRNMFCEKNADGQMIFKAEKKSKNSFKNVTQAKPFKAGCRQKVCDMCTTPGFQLPVETIDDCAVYKCPKSYMVVNGETPPAAGDIRCTQIGDNKFDWTFNGEIVQRVSCPDNVRCSEVSPLTCAADKDGSEKCDEQLDSSPSVVMCKKQQQMRVHLRDGTVVPVKSLVCNSDSGKFKMQVDQAEEPELPNGAVINCTAAGAPSEKEGGPNTEQVKSGQTTLYAAVGASVVIAAIVLAVVIFCCLRRRRKAGKLPATTTTASKTTLRTTKTMSGETKTPARTTVPIPPPTPIAPPLQRADADLKPWDAHLTERTPNAPTPLIEQRTQDQRTDRREKSKTKSLPMAEPPTPKAETAQPEGEESKSGMESTKKREDRTFKQDEEYLQHLTPLHPPKRLQRRASSHHDRSAQQPTLPTQGEESTKQTQKDSKTKTKTQRTQDMRTDEAANEEAAPRIPSRPSPKKADYVGLADAGKDSYDSEETKKSPAKGPMKPAAKTPAGETPYLKLEDLMSEHQQKKKKKDKEETRKTEKDGSVMLVTQDSEESMKKSK